MKTKTERLEEAFKYLKSNGLAFTQKDIADAMGTTPPNVSSAFNGNSRNLTNNFLRRFNSSFNNIFNDEWLLNGEGEMLLESDIMIQNNNGGNNQQGKLNTQNNSSEKIFKDFINALKGQNEVAIKSMEQTSKAIESTNNALTEISKQREQMDRLISMIENLQSSTK